MATNAIAIDMERVSAQFLKREKRILGQAASEKGFRSTSEYLRHLVGVGMQVEDPSLAAKYHAARSSRYVQKVGLAVIGLLMFGQALALDSVKRGSARTTSRPVQVVTVRAARRESCM